LKLRVYTSEKAVSLKRVARDIADVAAREPGVSEVEITYGANVDPALVRDSDAAIVVMPFDVVWAITYMYIAWEFWNASKPSLYYATIEGRVVRPAMREWISRDLRFAANSKYTEMMLADVGVKVEAVVYHGVDTKAVASYSGYREDMRKSLGLGSKPAVLYVASGHKRKCHDIFADVVKEASNAGLSAEFLVLTDKEGAKHYQGTDAHVIDKFGSLPEDYIYKLYHAVDIYTHASCAEGFGLPVLEALAAGKVVVHPDYAPLSEITDDATSFRVPVADVVFSRLEPAGIEYEIHLYDPAEMVKAIATAVSAVKGHRGRDIASRARKRASAFDKWDVYKELLAVLFKNTDREQ